MYAGPHFLQSLRHGSLSREVFAPALLAAACAFLLGSAIMAFFLAKKIIVLVIMGAIAGGIALVLSGNPRLFCLWGLVLTAPLSLGKRFMGGAASYNIEVADIFLLALLVFVLRDFLWGLRDKPRFSGVTAWWLGLILLGCLSILLGPFRKIAGHEVFQMMKHLVLFWVLINEVVRVRQFLHVAGALFAGMFLQGIVGLVQYVFKANLGLQVLGEATAKSIEYASKATYLDSGVFRIGALLGHPNLLAAYLALLLPIAIALLFSGIRPLYKLLLMAVTALGAVVLVLTLSRAGWISFAAAFAALLGLSFLHPRLQKRYLMARLVVIGVMAAFVLAFSGAIVKRFTQSDPGAVNFRYEWVGVAWNMVREKPLLGFGLNSFVFHMPQYTSYGSPKKISERFGEDWPVVHNIYMLIWAEQGTLGLLLFLGFNLHVLRLGWRNLQRFENDVLFVINIGCVSGFLALILDGLGSFFIRNPACGRMYWIVVALIVAIHYWTKANVSKAGVRPQPPAGPPPRLLEGSLADAGR
jgi:putative inorganic carbon (hco3(-)) transporter